MFFFVVVVFLGGGSMIYIWGGLLHFLLLSRIFWWEMSRAFLSFWSALIQSASKNNNTINSLSSYHNLALFEPEGE